MARKIDVRQETIDGITRRIADLNEQSLTQLSQYISYLKWQEELWHSLLDEEPDHDPDQALTWQYDFVEAFPAARKIADACAGHDGNQDRHGLVRHGAADGDLGAPPCHRQRRL